MTDRRTADPQRSPSRQARRPPTADGEAPVPPRPLVALRGAPDALRIIVSTGDAGLAETALRDALQRRGSFFAGARVDLELQAEAIDTRLADRLAALIGQAGMILERIEARPPGRTRRPPGEPGIAAARPSGTNTAVLHWGTLRGGQRLVCDSSVVVLGDVNPGAEIVALGSVIVWGRLRGKVEAGVDGDATAVVCALDLAPSQLRIGPVIARAPDDPLRSSEPEVARLREGQIVVTAWR